MLPSPDLATIGASPYGTPPWMDLVKTLILVFGPALVSMSAGIRKKHAPDTVPVQASPELVSLVAQLTKNTEGLNSHDVRLEGIEQRLTRIEQFEADTNRQAHAGKHLSANISQKLDAVGRAVVEQAREG